MNIDQYQQASEEVDTVITQILEKSTKDQEIINYNTKFTANIKSSKVFSCEIL